jgi:ATP-dependent Lon protease
MSQENFQHFEDQNQVGHEETERVLPLLPLRGILVFPYMVVHLDVGREKSVNAID